MKPEDELETLATSVRSDNGIHGNDKCWWNDKWQDEVKKKPIFDVSHVEIAARIVTYLGAECLFDSLEKFLYKVQNCFPKQFHENFLKNEIFLMGMIELKLWQKRFRDVYTLIENGKFSDPKSLISIWDKAHYSERQIETGKQLTPVSKFRIREKHPPPPNICPNGIRSGHMFPKSAQKVLKGWLDEHAHYPFPTRHEMEEMVTKTGLKLQQVRNWFSNTRRRSPEKRKQTQDNRTTTTGRRNLLPKLLKCGNENSNRPNLDQPLTSEQQNAAQISKQKEISSEDDTNKDLIPNQIIIVYVPVYHQQPPPHEADDVTSGQLNNSCRDVESSSVVSSTSQNKLIESIVAPQSEHINIFENSDSSNEIYSSDVSENVLLEDVLIAPESDSSLIIELFDLQNHLSGSQDTTVCSEIDMKQVLAVEGLLNLSNGLIDNY